MRPLTPRTAMLAAAGLAIAIAAGAAGYGIARLSTRPAAAPPVAGAAVKPALYWYDPMVPAQHFDKAGKSPFMDMQLVPRYADEAPGGAGVRIDPAAIQSLGVRLATVQRGDFAQTVEVTGVLDFNQRDVAIVQARSAGFVQRVYGRAPGDVVAAGAPIADVLVPAWGGAQSEYLAVRQTGDAALEAAAVQRLRLLGMPEALIAEVGRTGRVRNIVTISTPVAGAIQTLDVRQGMTVAAGQTLAQVAGLSSVWLNAQVPEALAGQVRVGQAAQARFAAFPSDSFAGRVTAILPTAQMESRTLQVRIELANRGGRLRPGMFATVRLGGETHPALFVPSEAVIRTGRRDLVMLAGDGGRFQAVEVKIGREDQGRTEVLAGLGEGQKVVASGQFLIDAEASLSGLQARPLGAAPTSPPSMAQPALYETRGRVEALKRDQITFSHEPVPAIGWPAMTMTFRLDPPGLARGLKVGDQAAFAFAQTPGGPVVRRITPTGAAR
jgi:Cu(I)/Ag(I) efflux system membrane fusion protein